MTRNPKLYQLSGEDFEAFDRVNSNGDLLFIPADNVPMIFWPDGRWCFEANVHMQELFHRNLSRKDGGGTLKTYAAQLSHLIRFCAQNRTPFIRLTDNHFALFIRSLTGERRFSSGPRVRESNSVIDIGRVCMDFFSTIAKLYDEPNFIGPIGQIRAERRTLTLASNNSAGKPRVISYWHHNALPVRSPYKKRLPIHSKVVTSLKEAVLKISGNNMYLRKRRYVMLKLLEITGARRLEIAELTVQSVLDAGRMAIPCLKLMTAKRDSHYRLVPISRTDLDFLTDFIKINRARLIKKKGGKNVDDGYLLISERSGKKLRTNTLTQEMAILRNAAGITESACAHMFRHRFITKIFVALIEQHRINNKDEFRQRMIDEESLQQIVQEWTGHMNKDSLKRYLNLAFVEIAEFQKSYDAVRMKIAVDSAQENIDQIDREFADGLISTQDLVQKLKYLMQSVREDISNARIETENAPGF